jgi:hypothetical protein
MKKKEDEIISKENAFVVSTILTATTSICGQSNKQFTVVNYDRRTNRLPIFKKAVHGSKQAMASAALPCCGCNLRQIIGATTLNITTLSITFRLITEHNDTQHNDTQHNDTQHNDTQHNDTQHNDTQHNYIQHKDAKLNDNHHNDAQLNGSDVMLSVQ